jgi:hypothetical protein
MVGVSLGVWPFLKAQERACAKKEALRAPLFSSQAQERAFVPAYLHSAGAYLGSSVPLAPMNVVFALVVDLHAQLIRSVGMVPAASAAPGVGPVEGVRISVAPAVTGAA